MLLLLIGSESSDDEEGIEFPNFEDEAIAEEKEKIPGDAKKIKLHGKHLIPRKTHQQPEILWNLSPKFQML